MHSAQLQCADLYFCKMYMSSKFKEHNCWKNKNIAQSVRVDNRWQKIFPIKDLLGKLKLKKLHKLIKANHHYIINKLVKTHYHTYH